MKKLSYYSPKKIKRSNLQFVHLLLMMMNIYNKNKKKIT